MLEVKTTSDSNIKQASPKVSSSPKMGRKSSWKEVNALLKNSMSFANINADFTFGSTPPKKDRSEKSPSKHQLTDSDNEDTFNTIKAVESVSSIEWKYSSDVSVLTSRSVDTYTSKVSSDNVNFEKDTSFGMGGGVAFRNPHRTDSFDDSDIPKVDAVEDDEEEEVEVLVGENKKQLVKVITPEPVTTDQRVVPIDDEESIVLRSRGNWIGGESLSTNKLAMLLSDMEVQLKNTASFLMDTADDYRNQRKLEGERVKTLLTSAGESVPENKKTLRGGAPKMVRSGSPTKSVVVPSYDDSKSCTSTVSANSTRSKSKPEANGRTPKRVNSNGSNTGVALTAENLAKKNAANATATASASKNGAASKAPLSSPPGAKSPLDAARGKAGFASPQRGRTTSPQRTLRPSTGGTAGVGAASTRDASVQRKPATAPTPGKPAPLTKSAPSALPATSAAGPKSSVRSATPNGRSRSVEPPTAAARRASSVQPATRASGTAALSSSTTSATTTAAAPSKRSATPTGRGMGSASRKLNEPVKKEALTPLVEKPALPKTPTKPKAAAKPEPPTPTGRKVSLKAPIPTLAAPPKRKSLPGSTTPGKPANGSAGVEGAPSPTKQPARRASTGGSTPAKKDGAAATAATGGANGSASTVVDPIAAAAAPILEKLSIPQGGVVYLPPQPEIYLSTLTHSTPNVIASMFSKCGPANSNTRAAAFAPPTMDALEEIIKKVVEERKSHEAALAAAASGGGEGMDVKAAGCVSPISMTVDKVLYATPSRAAVGSSSTPAQRRSASVERLNRPSTSGSNGKSDLHVWPTSAEPSVDDSNGSGNLRSPLKSTRSSAPVKPRFSVK